MRPIWFAILLGLTFSSVSWGQSPDRSRPGKMRVYVGTYTGPKSRGIYLLELDLSTGTLVSKGLAAATVNPSFLAIHPNRKFLYAANEVGDFQGQKTGSVSGFAIDAKSGLLTPLNVAPSGGGDPCYVVVDPTGRNLLVANYSGGSVEVVPIGTDGKLGSPSSVIQHRGQGADPFRQSGPHAHSIDLDASGRVAIAADLGLDKLLIYRLDAENGRLTPNQPAFVAMSPGSGPRHFAFHPDGRHAFAINEMASTLNAFDYDPASGALQVTQSVTSRGSGGEPGNSTAEILVHPSGKFVYGSNRGDDTLAIFAVDPVSGKLSVVGHHPTGGKTPRSFGIDPTGKYLIAANQNSDSLVVFQIDPTSGRLAPVGKPVEVPSPVCVKFLPILD